MLYVKRAIKGSILFYEEKAILVNVHEVYTQSYSEMHTCPCFAWKWKYPPV